MLIECPHVVEVLPGEFVLFRNLHYGQNAESWVYYSHNPLNFGIDEDYKLACTLKVAATEVILHEGQYYLATLNPGLDGIRIARLRWARAGGVGPAVFDFEDEQVRRKWRCVEGHLTDVFTTSTRSSFNPPTKHFIGTAEIGDNKLDDDRMGVIESPPFKLTEDAYMLFVSGGSNQSKTYVAIIDAEGGKEIARFTGAMSNGLVAQRFEVHGHQGKTVRIRVVDRAKGNWGHVNFGGIFAAGPGDFIDAK